MARMTKPQKKNLAKGMLAKAEKLFVKGCVGPGDLAAIRKIAKKAIREADKNYPGL